MTVDEILDDALEKMPREMLDELKALRGDFLPELVYHTARRPFSLWIMDEYMADGYIGGDPHGDIHRHANDIVIKMWERLNGVNNR